MFKDKNKTKIKKNTSPSKMKNLCIHNFILGKNSSLYIKTNKIYLSQIMEYYEARPRRSGS